MKNRMFRWILIALPVFVSFNNWAQYAGMDLILGKEIESNHNYLERHAIHLCGGNMPFQQNGKWGIQDGNGKILLEPVYDSLYNVAPGFFVAKNKISCKLLDSNLWNYLDTTISYVNNTDISNELVVRRQTGYNSYFKIETVIGYNEYGQQILVPLIKAKPKTTISVNNPPVSKPLKRRSDSNPANVVYNLYQENSYCDSIRRVENIKTQEVKYIFYKEGLEYGSLQDKGMYDLFYEDSLTWYSNYNVDKDRKEFHVLNIKTLKEIVSFPAEKIQVINNKGKLFFRIETYSDHDYKYSVYGLDGKFIAEINQQSKYESGSFRERSPGKDDVVDFYSFPDHKLMYANLKRVDNYGNLFELFQGLETEQYLLFHDGKLLQTFSGKEKVRIYTSGTNKRTNSSLVSLFEGKQNYVFSSNGMVFKSRKGVFINAISFDEEFGYLVLYASSIKVERRYGYGIYSEKEDRVIEIPYEIILEENSVIINEKWMLSFEYSDDYEIRGIFFQDLNGSCLDERIYTDFEYTILGNSPFVQLSNNKIPSIYNERMEKVCEGCYLKGNFSNEDFMVVNPHFNKKVVEVWDKDLKPVFSEDFLAVDYSSQGEYFIVLDQNHQIRYIPLSETKLAKKK